MKRISRINNYAQERTEGGNMELRILAVTTDRAETNGNRQPEDALQRPDAKQKAHVEAFWAGRNRAMRRSARVAA